MKKRIVSGVLAVVLILTLSVYSLAATKMHSVVPKLTFNGATATCSASIVASGYIDATLELYCSSTLIDSWSATGTNYLNLMGSTSVVSGNTYTLRVSGTAGGEVISSTPVTKTCP